jgi:hypothetical protein
VFHSGRFEVALNFLKGMNPGHKGKEVEEILRYRS